MKQFAVYGADLTNALNSFDSLNDAIESAKKGLRKWSKTVKDTKAHKTVYRVHKNNNGEIVEHWCI